MKRELYAPVMRAITALVLVIMVKLVAMMTLGDAGRVYSAVSIALSLAVVVILLRFRLEFNRELVISKPEFPEARSFITGIILLLGILIAAIQVYLLWNILNKNSRRLSELMLFHSSEGERTCSCGWENPENNNFDNIILIFHRNAYIEPQTIRMLSYKREFVQIIEQKITFYGGYSCQDN